MQTQFGSKQPQVWLEFAFWCQHTSWLWQQVDSLDSRYLIRLAQLLPDHRELIEQKNGQTTKNLVRFFACW